jgi:hypothetical protein
MTERATDDYQAGKAVLGEIESYPETNVECRYQHEEDCPLMLAQPEKRKNLRFCKQGANIC